MTTEKPPLENPWRMRLILPILILFYGWSAYRAFTVQQESPVVLFFNLGVYTFFQTLFYWLDGWVLKRKGEESVSLFEMNGLFFSQALAIVSSLFCVLFSIEAGINRKAFHFNEMKINTQYASLALLGLVFAMFYMPLIGSKKSMARSVWDNLKNWSICRKTLG
jgi:uncharacterized membrane protein